MKQHKLIKIFHEWAEQESNIEGVILVGSHARNEATPDSDIDLMILTDTPLKYLNDTLWISHFGIPSLISFEDWGNVQSIRVFYTDGPEVEYGITTPDWATHPIPESTKHVIKNGMRLLFDRKGRFKEALEKSSDN